MSDEKAAKRAAQLNDLLKPAHTAVLTMELQGGVVGDEALLPALVTEVRETNVLPITAEICNEARRIGVRVVHCTAENRFDGAGSSLNCKLFAMGAKMARERGGYLFETGSPGARLMPELGPDPRDILVPRIHGMTPFTSTSLDQILRNMGIKTVVVTGVSVNLGVMGMALTALDLGYQVVIVRDAVAGVPREYAQAALDNSLSFISTIVTSAEVLGCWKALASAA